MEQEQTPKEVQPEDTEIIQIEEENAKREFNTCWFRFLFFSAPGVLCPPLGVLLRPGPWSGRLLKRCLYSDSRPH